MGVENYVATFRLIPVTDLDHTFAEWTAEFDAAPEREDGLVQSHRSVTSLRLASARSRRDLPVEMVESVHLST